MKKACADLVEIRRELHANPELSGKEFQTALKIVKYISQFHPTEILENIGGTGVVAIFSGKEDGPIVLFRAELDALPIDEINDFNHKSATPNISHKCGHDGHMAILLGLAERFYQQPLTHGKVVLLFQPAEEIGSGAQSILEDKRFKSIKPDYVFALHNLPGYPLHQIILKKDNFTASVKSLIAKFYGKPSHAAEPENGINPAQALASIITNTKALSNNNSEKADFTLITPVHVNLGSIDYGISAGYGELHLTMRTWNEDHLNVLFTKVKEIIKSVANSNGLKVEIEPTHHFAANQNDSDAVDIINQSANELKLSVHHPSHPFKWGEDFGLFTHSYKGAIFGIGAGLNTPALHNPEYDFPDEIISTGVNLFHKVALNILN